MIIKASQRGGGRALAQHLMNDRDNDHVELHEVRGFVADNLSGAFAETEALAKGTRCKQYLFSVSLSPPQDENVRPEVFETAAKQVETELGLEGQSRAIVFHEKEGRRHAHVVWSRIDAANMRAVNLPHFKRKLNDISRGLFLDHGWSLPDGFKRGRESNPLNFTLAEWQQAKRAGKNPSEIKATFQECWNKAKSGDDLIKGLRERGYFLAAGDRRDFVAIDYQGEIYSLTRMTGVRVKAARALLGDIDLKSVAETKSRIADLYTLALKRHVESAQADTTKQMQPLLSRKADLVAGQKAARVALSDRQKVRWTQESKTRQERFARGWRGVWDWLRGKNNAIRKRNEMEVTLKRDRDRQEMQALIQRQQAERQVLQNDIQAERRRHALELAGLYRDLARTKTLKNASGRDKAPDKSRRTHAAGRNRSAGHTRDRTLEREL